MCNKSELQIILTEMADIAKATFGEQLESVILYGSYARGDYDQESDIDIMILVKGIPFDKLWLYKKPIISKESELGLKYDMVISTAVKDAETFNRYIGILPFYKNVAKEGIKVA